MKSVIVNSLFILSAIAAGSFAHAAATRVQLPLTEEKIINEKTGDKLCFYKIEINLGDAKTTRPYQVMKETDANKFEEMRNWHAVSINDQGHFILKVTGSSSGPKDASCAASQEVLLLN